MTGKAKNGVCIQPTDLSLAPFSSTKMRLRSVRKSVPVTESLDECCKQVTLLICMCVAQETDANS